MTRRLTALLLASFAAWAEAGPPEGLCVPSEKTFFSCRIRDGRWISLCGAPPASLQYRFGKREHIELRFPEKAEEGPSKLRYAHYFRFQTERAEIAFDNQGVAYAVYDYTEKRKRDAGARVDLPGGKTREFACAGRIVSRLSELEKVLPCDADNALNLGGCPRADGHGH
jgi:hypothetical protein